jgi:hypothetical protein
MTDRNGDSERLEPLLASEQSDRFRGRWQSIQGRFVDEPESAVQEADELVKELMSQLSTTFDEERQSVESQLARKEDTSTEDYRVALKRYRSFFERLLST